MRLVCATPCSLALWAFFALFSAAHAQPSGSTPAAGESTLKETTAEKDSANPNLPVQEAKPTKPWESESDRATAGPDIFLLPDKNGKLRQVLGFRYEEFQRAWQQQNQDRQAAPPLYTLGALDVSGTADQNRAKLEFKLEILPRTKGWVGVSLQLSNLIVQQWELDNQSDEECLVFDQKERGYVLWLKSESNQPRSLTLHGLVKLLRGSTNPELEINLPRSSHSQFVMEVPGTATQFEASPGIDLTTRATEEGGTEVRLTGQASPLRLRWGTQDERKQALNTVFEATGEIAIHVDRYRAHYDAVFEINSYGKPLDRLRVLLPEGAIWTKESLTDNYRITVLDAQDGIVEVQLSEPLSEPWELHLTAERQRDEVTLTESLCSVSGFNVLEAFRQSGTVKLSIDDQLQAYFDLYQDIEQVTIDEKQQPSSSRSIIAQFEYARLPWTLDVNTVARKQRVGVEPKYTLKISRDQAELHLKLDYQFAGGYTPAVRIKMHGWKLTDDQIESGGVVNPDHIKSEQKGLLVLPIKNPKAERVPISLVARRDIQLGHLELPLPEPLHTFVLPGQLTVESEPSLRVSRSANGTRGISIAPATNRADPTTSNHTSLNREIVKEVLELRTFLADTVLGVDVTQRDREATVDINTKIEVGLKEIVVSQQLRYDVKYQPITQLQLQIPEPLWNNDSLRVRLDGEEVPIGLGIFSEDLPADPSSEPAADLPDSSSPKNATVATTKIRPLIVSLPRPMQGDFLLEIDYKEVCPELAVEALTPTLMPLVMPENNIRANTISVLTEKSILATLNQTTAQGPWKASQGTETQNSETPSLRLNGTGKPIAVPLFMQIESEGDTQRATLEFAWLQTWIVDRLQQDRAVFRFHTDQPSVFAQLPADLLSPAIEVLLDRVTTEFNLSATNRLEVAIPNDQALLSHTLEIRYHRDVELSSWGNLVAKLPRLDSRETSAPVYWQLVLPRGWHVASSPQQFSGEFWLGWQDYQWGRHPTHYQSDLERLTGATHSPPPASSNQYLFRGFEIPREASVLVLSQAWLVFPATLIAFGIGMLILYTPLIRYGLFWLVLALALAAMVVVSPSFTMLAVQAIFWAGLMTIAATILRRLFVDVPRPYFIMDTDIASNSTAVTASWKPEAESKSTSQESHSTSLRTGGSAS